MQVRNESPTVIEPDAEDDPAPHGAGDSKAEGKIPTTVRDVGGRLVYESADATKAPVKKNKAVIVDVIDKIGGDGQTYKCRGLKGKSCNAMHQRGTNI